MRRRGNQPYAGRGMAHFSDPVVHFVPRQLSAFAGFGALCHFDLQFVGFGEVKAGDPKPTRCHLFDGAAHTVAIGQTFVAFFVFAAFAGIAFCAKPVHGDG